MNAYHVKASNTRSIGYPLCRKIFLNDVSIRNEVLGFFDGKCDELISDEYRHMLVRLVRRVMAYRYSK
jgi:hypothetical protein